MYIFRIKREGNILDLIQIKYMILGKIANFIKSWILNL